MQPALGVVGEGGGTSALPGLGEETVGVVAVIHRRNARYGALDDAAEGVGVADRLPAFGRGGGDQIIISVVLAGGHLTVGDQRIGDAGNFIARHLRNSSCLREN